VIALAAAGAITVLAFVGLGYVVWSIFGEKDLDGCPPPNFASLPRPISFRAEITSVGVLDYEEDAGDVLLYLRDAKGRRCQALYKSKTWPGPRTGWVTIHAEYNPDSMEPPIEVDRWTVP